MNNLRYFYRKQVNGKPMAGTLISAVDRPKTGKWGEIKKEDYERKISCCDPDIEDAILSIDGPTGTISAGSEEYEFTIDSEVTGIAPELVDYIALYIDDTFVVQQPGAVFTYDGSAFAETPEVPIVYYTIAVLVDGTTLVSPILQFTLTNAAPAWTFQQAFYIGNNAQVMHICDYVTDVNLDTLNVTFLTLPAFITPALIPVTDVNGLSVMVVDLTVTPTGVGDNGTYSFTMVASDGVKTTNKVVSLIIDGNTHQRITVRPTTNISVPMGTPAFTTVNTFTVSSQQNGIQNATVPSPNILALAAGTGPGAAQVNTTALPVAPGKQVTLIQGRNGTTGTGNRYEDCMYFITTVTP